jgi:adenosylmethionine-8-amino-7-oxononanoate aminotransferase
LSHVFHRTADPLTAAVTRGVWVHDDEGHQYLDAAAGALVVNVGHGDPDVVAALGGAARAIDYVHPTVFTTEVLESYAAELAPLVPVDDVRVYPTSGGAESVETALKLARAYHLARGEPGRDVVVSRSQSYHGNTLGALDASGRPSLRGPYEPWLGRFEQAPAANEYRCANPRHPDGCAQWHASRLDELMTAAGEGRVAAFIAEASGGASIAAAVPPPGYWEAIADVCTRHGALLIVDEVMTGFGRTGRWFAIEHGGIRPDIIVSGKGAGGGYYPLGLCMASGGVHDTVVDGGGFTHGYTFSHSPIGAAVGRAVLRRLITGSLVQAAHDRGVELVEGLRSTIGAHPLVGDIRGLGLLIGVELVADRKSRAPHPRSNRLTERLVAAARGHGLLVYPAAGCADGVDGDGILLGPPFIVTDEDIRMIVERLAAAIGDVA